MGQLLSNEIFPFTFQFPKKTLYRIMATD